jgi:DNA invertase Pin-like site-specific DNA recombinase
LLGGQLGLVAKNKFRAKWHFLAKINIQNKSFRNCVFARSVLWLGIMNKAHIYARVSGRSQLMDGTGIDRQLDVCRNYAKAHDLTIEQEFIEQVSGTKESFDRIELTNLFVAIKSNGVRIVLVETASRLSRDLLIGEVLLNEFRKLGVKVIDSASDNDLTVLDNDPTKILVRQLLNAVSAWEKSMLVQKLRVARMRIRAATGKCDGRKQYGHTEPERAVIAQILVLRGKGMKTADICQTLNNQGIKPRTALRAGKVPSWHPTMIARIIARKT